MDLGVARSIAVEHIASDDVTKPVNNWLKANPNVEVIDIKVAASANEDNWNTDALIIYRKEN